MHLSNWNAPSDPRLRLPGSCREGSFFPNHCPLVFWKQAEFDSVCVWLEKPLFEGLLLKKYKRFLEPLQCLKDFSLRLGGAERGARNALSSGIVGGPDPAVLLPEEGGLSLT